MIQAFRGEYEFLSNFYERPFEFHGFTVPSGEHAFQAQKTVIPAEKLQIVGAATPSLAKYWGRACTMRSNWDVYKDAVMLDVIQHKFADPEMAELLLATGDEELQEGNTWNDKYWGVCRGKGLNKLGKILMDVRESLR